MPFWLRGLIRFIWYFVIAPVSVAHMALHLLGGGEIPKWIFDIGPGLMVWLGIAAIEIIVLVQSLSQ